MQKLLSQKGEMMILFLGLSILMMFIKYIPYTKNKEFCLLLRFKLNPMQDLLKSEHILEAVIRVCMADKINTFSVTVEENKTVI